MKKILAFVLALGVVIGGGVNFSASADDGGYLDFPDWHPITNVNAK